MKLLQDERAENPIEVGMYVLLCIFTMALVIFVTGGFLDRFLVIISGVDITLSPWGQDMMQYPIMWASWVFLVPSLFIIIVMVWGIKTVIKKKQYSTQQDGTFMNYEEEI